MKDLRKKLLKMEVLSKKFDYAVLSIKQQDKLLQMLYKRENKTFDQGWEEGRDAEFCDFAVKIGDLITDVSDPVEFHRKVKFLHHNHLFYRNKK